MKKYFNSTTRLILAVIALFVLIVYSFQVNHEQSNFKPYETTFSSSIGPLKLSQFKGKIVLMYFGFLTCPEACPTTLSKISNVFKTLSPEDLNKIEMLFIDLDPERDTLEKMKAYTNFFHPKIISLTSDLHTLKLFARFFGVEFRKIELKSNMGYTIDHSTDIIVLSPEGNLLPNIHHEADTKLLTLTINDLIKNQSKK